MKMKTPSFILALASLALASLALGQKPPAAAPVGPEAAYHIQVTIHDAAAGAAGPSHNFSFNVLEGSQDTIQTGDRVPVKSSSDQFTYVPIGFKVTCQLPADHSTKPGHLRLDLQLSISAVVPPASGGSAQPPVLRSTDATINAVVPLGTRASVAEFNDASGKTTYNVEVLATPATP